MLWIISCSVVFQVFPNVFLKDVLNSISFKVLRLFEPPNPDPKTIYDNFPNIGNALLISAVLATIILIIEAYIVVFLVKKGKRYLQQSPAPKNKVLKRLSLEKHLGKYVGFLILAGLLIQIAYLKYSNDRLSLKPEDKPTQELYLKMYVLINTADQLQNNKKEDEAKKCYEQAYYGLSQIQKEKPNWEPTIIKYRLHYVREKLGISESTEK
ncbi:MAG: hypothetical protein EBV19_10185 [Flavobacteriia bacterium]|nr:hypothetical protein [Flavobacteriia bacterium]